MTFTLTINGTEYEIPFAGNFVKDEESGLWVSRDKVDYTDKTTKYGTQPGSDEVCSGNDLHDRGEQRRTEWL